MRLKVGDKIYSKVSSSDITLDKAYVVTQVRDKTHWTGDDICILDNSGLNWWFGQIGETECWTGWFISEKEWIRNKKLEELGI